MKDLLRLWLRGDRDCGGGITELAVEGLLSL